MARALPPCEVDKELLKNIGGIIERESEAIFKEVFRATREEMKLDDYYKKRPEELTEDEVKENIRSAVYEPVYRLESNVRNVESIEISSFIDTEWPVTVNSIKVSLGDFRSAKRIAVDLHLEGWRTSRSKVTVSGQDGVWVNGIAMRLESIFKDRQLSYSPLVSHQSLRVLVSLIAWFSLLYAVMYPLWPIVRTFLREGVVFEELYFVIALLGCFFAVWPLEEFLKRVFPRFEYGKGSIARRARKWIWAIFVSSGLLSAVILRLLSARETLNNFLALK